MQAYFMSSARRDDSNGEAQTTDDKNQRGKYAAPREDFTPPEQSEPRMSDRGIKGISGESVVCMAWFRLHAAGAEGTLVILIISKLPTMNLLRCLAREQHDIQLPKIPFTPGPYPSRVLLSRRREVLRAPGQGGSALGTHLGGELFEVLAEEALYLIEGYFVHSVVEVRVAGTGDDVELAVRGGQQGIGGLREVTGVRLLAVHQ